MKSGEASVWILLVTRSFKRGIIRYSEYLDIDHSTVHFHISALMVENNTSWYGYLNKRPTMT